MYKLSIALAALSLFGNTGWSEEDQSLSVLQKEESALDLFGEIAELDENIGFFDFCSKKPVCKWNEPEDTDDICCLCKDTWDALKEIDRHQRIVFQYLAGNGIGFSHGYGSIDGFFSYSPDGNYNYFADIRPHIMNDGNFAFNGGFGVRRFLSTDDPIYGANLFYDYRHQDRCYNQIGFGLEALWQTWTARVNGYFPFNDRSNHGRYTFIGGNVELSKRLYYCYWLDLEGMLGVFVLGGRGNNTKNTGGGTLGLSARLSPYFTLKGNLAYDHLFQWTGSAVFSINIPFGCRVEFCDDQMTCREQDSYGMRFVEQVSRFEIIPTSTARR